MTDNQDQLHFLDYWRVIRARKEVVIAVFLLVVIAGVLVTYSMPRYYRSSCVILVKEESPDVAVFSREINSFNPLFLRTQFEIIQSRPVIEEAIRKLGLERKLGRAYGYESLSPEKVMDRTVKILGRSMTVQQYRDTNLIEIRVDLAEPQETAPREAAAAANMIAEVYREQSRRRTHEATERALSALYDALEEQKKRVSLAETAVEEIRQQYKLDMIGPFAGGSGSLDKMSLTRLEDLRLQVRLDMEDKKARYEKMISLSPEDLLDAAPYVAGDQALVGLLARKRSAEVQLSELTQGGSGPRHPDVVRVKAVIQELTTKINEALKGLITGLQADYEAARNKVDAIATELEVRRATERTAEAGAYRLFTKAQEELSHARKIRDALEMRYLQEKIELRIPRTAVEVVERAKPPDTEDPSSPNIVLNVLLSIIVGLGSGIGLAYFIEYMDTSLKTVEDIERYMTVPVIGVIPQKVRPFIETGAETGPAEAYRVLRANLQFSERFKNGRYLCVTSGSVGEGKSLTVFNLAYICAQLGDRTLIVDSDLHRPRQHKMFKVSNRVGLANILVGEQDLDSAILSTGAANLDFLPSGKLTTGVHGLLDNSRMKDLIATLGERYDIVLYDAPPMIGVSDASLLVREMQGVLLVIQHRKYPRTVSSRAKDMVLNVGGNLVGVVLNNINVSRDYYYYYHHYYSYDAKPKATESA